MRTFNVTIPGFTIACKAWGDSTLPPMLAIHGWLDNANSFAPLAPYLAQHFYLIAIDLPGHGLSSHLVTGCHYHFIDGIFIINAIINALSITNIHLLGHSLGACLGSLVAGVIPSRILSLTLIEALGPFSSPENTCQTQLAHYVETILPKTGKQDSKLYDSLEQAAEARAQSGHLSIELARLFCQRGVKEENGQFYWRHDRRLLAPTPLRLTEGQVLACLEAIAAKTCLIFAKNGFAFNEDLLQQRIDALQNKVIYRINGGHHLHMENPQSLIPYLTDFFETI